MSSSMPVFASIKKDVTRHVRTYAEAQSRRPELAPYPSIPSVLGVLAGTSADHRETRHALASVLVEEAQREGAPAFWPSLLLVAFEPMLRRIRFTAGLCAGDTWDDVDARVIAAFLGAVRTIRPGPYTPTALRWATLKEVHGAVRASRRETTERFEENTHSDSPWAHACRDADRIAATEIIALVESKGDAEMLDVLLATTTGDETLRTYVDRTFANLATRARASAYERLCRARNRIFDQVRARFDRQAA